MIKIQIDIFYNILLKIKFFTNIISKLEYFKLIFNLFITYLKKFIYNLKFKDYFILYFIIYYKSYINII